MAKCNNAMNKLSSARETKEEKEEANGGGDWLRNCIRVFFGFAIAAESILFFPFFLLQFGQLAEMSKPRCPCQPHCPVGGRPVAVCAHTEDFSSRSPSSSRPHSNLSLLLVRPSRSLVQNGRTRSLECLSGCLACAPRLLKRSTSQRTSR